MVNLATRRVFGDELAHETSLAILDREGKMVRLGSRAIFTA